MNNKIIEIQNVLFEQLKRLDSDEIMSNFGEKEIARSNSISNTSLTYLKAVNVNIKIKEISEKSGISYEKVNKELGVANEK